MADATLFVAPGRQVALTGPSGVGKSTLLRAVAALDDVTAGAITVGNVSVSDVDEDGTAPTSWRTSPANRD